MMEQNERYFSISDVAKRLEVSAGTIRNWEREFPDYIKVFRDPGGSRFYTESTVQRLEIINKLRNKGFSIPGIQKYISESDTPDNIDPNLVIDYDSPMPVLAPTTNVEEFRRQLVHDVSSYFDERFNEQKELITELQIQLQTREKELQQRDRLIEESLKERDRKLMETLHAIREASATKEELKKGFFQRLFGG